METSPSVRALVSLLAVAVCALPHILHVRVHCTTPVPFLFCHSHSLFVDRPSTFKFGALTWAVKVNIKQARLFSLSEMEEARSERAREALEVAYAMSNLLKTGLDRPTLAVLMALTEQGVNPEALAAVVKELRREAAALRSASVVS